MAWQTIPAKTTARSYSPTIRLKKGMLYLSSSTYDLICTDKSAKCTYVAFLFNDATRAVYITQADAKTKGAIRIPAKSKGTKADLLQEYLHDKYGKVNKFSVDKKALNREGNKTFMINPIKDGK